MEEATRLGIMNTGDDGYVCEFEEKPAHPKSDLASMGIYIFNWQKLKEYLIADEKDPDSAKDFGKNIIPAMLAAGERLWPYRFEGYWRDVGTIGSLWDANMDMLSDSHINLYDPSWPINSRSPVRPPHFTGANARIVNSIMSEGDDVNGTIVNSVLSPSVFVGEGARISSSVIMPGAVISSGAVVEYSIIGENVVVGNNARVGTAPDGSAEWNVATVGPNVDIREGAVVPAGAMIYKSEEV